MFLPTPPFGHIHLDEFLAGALLPTLLLTLILWYKVIELRREVAKRHGAEKALRKSESRLNAAQQLAHIGDWEWDVRRSRISWSDELYRIFDLKPGERPADAATLLKAMRLRDGEELSTVLTEAQREKGRLETVCSFLRGDGSLRDLRTIVRGDVDAEGTLRRARGTVQDITEYKRMTGLLAEKEARLRTLVQTIPDLVWLKDTEGVFLLCNNMLERFLGAAEARIVGKTDYDFFDRTLADSFREQDRKAMAAGGPSRNEEWVTFAEDGRRALLETIKTPMVDTQGQLVGVLGIARDITVRKRAEEALRESEERFRLAFEQSAEGIVFAEYGSGRIVYANATVGRLLGHALSELQEGNLAMILRHFDPTVVAELPDVRLQPDFISPRVATTDEDGNERIISLRIRLVELGGKDLKYLSLRDMTEKVRLEDEARASHARLIHANKLGSLGMLVSGMAHEINNPNNFIMFNASMLADIWRDALHILDDYRREYGEFNLGGLPYEEIGGATRKLIDGIVEGSQRIKTIVDDLKDFARQDKSAPNGPLAVNRAVLKAISILTPQIKKQTTQFGLDLDENLPDACGNPQQIEQVIINLLLNALQALPAKNCGVRIATALAESGAVRIVVRDQGTGMEEATLKRLAEPFFTTKSASAGTGLGLFISQSIVEEHRGRLHFDSTLGQGTSVTVELPPYPSQGASHA